MLALTSFIRHTLACLTAGLIFSVAIPVALVNRPLGHRLGKLWARAMCWIYGIRVTVIDENHGYYEPGGNVVVTLNQASLTETYIGTFALPVPCRVIVNFEYVLLHLSGWFNLALGGHMIVRQWSAQARRSVNRAVGVLARREGNYWISVEGKRSPDGELQPYKKGTAVIAIEAQATIIPMVFLGARERMRLGSWQIRPGEVTVVLCSAITTTGLSYADRDYLLDRLRKVAQEKLHAT